MNTPVVFRKTLLALAVTGATMPVLAQTLGQDGLLLQDAIVPVEVTGSFNGAFAIDSDAARYAVIEGGGSSFGGHLTFKTDIDAQGDGIAAIELWDPKINGDVLLAGTTKVTGGDFTEFNDGELDTWGVHGVVITGELENNQFLGEIRGSLRHTGTLEVEGTGNAEAVGLYLSEVATESVNNEGRITVKGHQAIGLKVESSRIEGEGLRNDGTIEVQGAGAQGIEVSDFRSNHSGYSEYSVYNSIRQGLTNQGTIKATGEDVVGIHLWDVHMAGVINRGEIRVEGDRSVGVDFDYVSSVAGLNNSGTIVASGANAYGVLVDGARFYRVNYGNGASSEAFGHDGRQIRNSGRIEGEDTAIAVGAFSFSANDYGATPDTEVVIVNSGTLKGGRAAIDAAWDDDGSVQGGPVRLEWDGGSIAGDLIGLSMIDIDGQVRYGAVNNANRNSAHIEMAANGRVKLARDASLELLGTHTALKGDLALGQGAALNLNLFDDAERKTDANQAILGVNGTATFAEGSRVTFKADNAAFTADDTTYVLLEATELVDNGLAVASNSLLLKLVGEPEVDLDNDQIRVTVTGKGGSDVAQLLEGSGASGAAAAAAGEFTNLLFSGGAIAEDDAVRNAFIAAMDESADSTQRRRLLTQLAPELNGGTQRAAISGQSLVNSVTAGRTSALRGLSSGDQPQQVGVWIQRLDSDATQDPSAGVNGYDTASSGIAFGVDGTRDNLTMGVAYSLLETDVTGVDNKATVDSYGFAIYGGWSSGAWFADGAFNYALSENEGTRTIATTTAKSEYSGSLVGGHLSVGYNLQLLQGLPVLNGLTVQPQVAARYSRVDIDAYEETGTSSARRAYEKQTFQVGELGFGARVAATIGLPYGSLQPSAKVMYFSDLIGDTVSTTSGYVLGSTPMVTYEGIEPETSTLEISLGVDYRMGNFTLGGSYDRASKSDFTADTLLAKVRYDF